MPKHRLTEKRLIAIKSDPRLPSRSIEDMVRTAREFAADIRLSHNGSHEVSAKSLLSVLELCAERPQELTAVAHGPDAGEAMAALERFFDSAVLEMCEVAARD